MTGIFQSRVALLDRLVVKGLTKISADRQNEYCIEVIVGCWLKNEMKKEFVKIKILL